MCSLHFKLGIGLPMMMMIRLIQMCKFSINRIINNYHILNLYCFSRGEYEHHPLDYFDTVALGHKKKWHPKAHAPAHAKHHVKHHAKPHHAILKAHADPHATTKKTFKKKHKKPIPPKKILDTSDEDDDDDDDDEDDSKLEHTKDGKVPDLTKSESDMSSSEGMKTTIKTTTEEEFRKARIRDKFEEMSSQNPKKKSN